MKSPSERRSEVRPIWSKGFRPFFFAAAIHAVLFLPIWIASYSGWIELSTVWTGADWHGHEMVFGFTIAVIAGFLLTAVSHWTGQETATGRGLIALVGLWVVGRVTVLASGVLDPIVVAATDLLFIPALAIAIGRPLIATGNKRNLMFLGILGAFWAANLTMHLDALGVTTGLARTGLLASVDLVIVVSLVIGGRIIPNFTRNAVGDDAIRSSSTIEKLVVPGAFLVLFTNVIAPSSMFTGVLNVALGALVLLRMMNWGTMQTLGSAILWVLHLGHAWIGVGLLVRGATILGVGPWPTLATHILTVGAIGTLTLGMMSRVALGHTGRALTVKGDIAFAYAMVTVAVIARAVVPWIEPSVAWVAYLVSSVAWTVAFAIYLFEYTPILFARRADA